jgi:hypothetical protein
MNSGRTLSEKAFFLFSRALYWTTDAPISPYLADRQHDDLGYNLGQHFPKRRFMPGYKTGKEEQEPPNRNGMLAESLVAEAAAVLVQQAIMLLWLKPRPRSVDWQHGQYIRGS